MSYADRRVEEAYRLVSDFAFNKARENVRPDVIHRQAEVDYNSRTQQYSRTTSGPLDGWVVAIRSNKCIVALESGDVIVGELKPSAAIFRKDRTKVSSYDSWQQHCVEGAFKPVVSGATKMPVEVAEIIVETLNVPSE